MIFALAHSDPTAKPSRFYTPLAFVLLLLASLPAAGESLFQVGNLGTWDSKPEATMASVTAAGRALDIGCHICDRCSQPEPSAAV